MPKVRRNIRLSGRKLRDIDRGRMGRDEDAGQNHGEHPARRYGSLRQPHLDGVLILYRFLLNVANNSVGAWRPASAKLPAKFAAD